MSPQDDQTPLGLSLARDLQTTQQQIRELMSAISKLDQRVFSGDKESLTMRQEFTERDIKELRGIIERDIKELRVTIEKFKADLELQESQGRQARQDILKLFLGMAGTILTGTVIWLIQTHWSPKPTPQPSASPSPEVTPLLPEGPPQGNSESGP